jgi:hypothetical protein
LFTECKDKHILAIKQTFSENILPFFLSLTELLPIFAIEIYCLTLKQTAYGNIAKKKKYTLKRSQNLIFRNRQNSKNVQDKEDDSSSRFLFVSAEYDY